MPRLTDPAARRFGHPTEGPQAQGGAGEDRQPARTFVSRGLGEGTGPSGSSTAPGIAGPATYGQLADRIGYTATIRLTSVVRAGALVSARVPPGFSHLTQAGGIPRLAS